MNGLSDALTFLASRLPRPWAIGGSLLLAAHGLAVQPRDIDLVVPAAAGPAVQAALPLADFSTGGTALWRSSFLATLQVGQWPVEIIGGLAIAHEEGVYRLPFGSFGPGSAVEPWHYQGATYPLLPLEEFYLIYLLYPEKAHRAALIEALLGRATLRRLAQRPGLPASVRQRLIDF